MTQIEAARKNIITRQMTEVAEDEGFAPEEIRALLPPGVTMSQFALRWILMFDAVTCAIPGGKRPNQVSDNCRASGLPPLSPEAMAAIRHMYDARFGPALQRRW